jgi:hypothetical protein
MSEERKPLCKCRQIDPAQVELEEGDEATRAYILSLLHLGELQAFSIYRYDNKSMSSVFYHPTRQILIVFYNGTTQGACEIPSMFQGLKWWIQEPEIWQQHVMRGER